MRHFETMGVGIASLQLERSQGDSVSLEALIQGDFLVEDTITTDGVDRAQLAAERIHDVGVVVPSAHAQCLLAVEVAIRIRGLEVGQAKDTFINDGQGVGHSLSCGFAHLHVNLLLRVGRFGDCDVGLQLQLLVFHLHGHHAIESDGQVVISVMRLNQGYIDIHVRDHLLGGRDFHLAFLSEVLHQHGLQHPVVGFHRDKSLGLVVSGEGHHHLLAHLVTLRRGLQRQLCRSARCG